MPSYPDQVRAAERAARRKRQRRGSVAGMAALRVAELNREFSDRYGADVLPDDDAGRDDAAIMLHHLARRSSEPRRRMVDWLDRRAPWLTGDERTTLLDRIVENPHRFKADTLAAKIGLTAERRARLRIKTIGAIDQTAAERAEARRVKKMLFCRGRRAAIKQANAANPI